MRNKFALLGFVSTLGFLGFYDDNVIYFSFFCFAIFFSYWKVPCDELFMQNIKSSSFYAFIVFAVGNIFVIVLSVFKVDEILYLIYPILATLSFMVFIFTLFYYEKLEKK